MSEVQLPEGWVWRKLGEISSLTGGSTPSRQNPEYFGGDIIWLTPTEIDKHKILVIKDSREKITRAGFDKSSTKIIPAGSVLLTSRASIGYVAIAGKDVTTNQGFISFTCSTMVDNLFLAHWLKSQKKVLEGKATGTTFKEISRGVVKSLDLPLPPLPVQQQIVARIDELFSELDAGVKELKTALARLKTYRQAVLHHYLNNPDWERTEIGNVCGCIVPNRDKPQSFSGDIYWITIPDLPEYSTSIDYSSVELGMTEEEVNQYKARLIPPGSVIMTCVGRFGLSAVVEYPLVINQQLHAFLPTENYLPKFIAYTIRLNRSYFERNATATTIAYLNKGKCNSMPIPLIDLTTQHQIVSEIEARLSEAEVMETTIRQELARAENLRQSILKQAFSGKLVTASITPIPAEELAEVSEPVSPFYGSPSGDQLTLF